MKYKAFILLFISICLRQISFSQTVPIDSVKFYEDKEITVCSKVVDTYVSKSEDATTFLNFQKPYPNTPFTAVIFASSLDKFNFSPSEYYKGKNICVTGKVKIFKGKPEIVISSPDQIKLAD